MTILVENEAEKELDFDYEEIIKNVVEKTIETENCPYEIEVNILLTNNTEIHEANVPVDFTLVDESPECYLNPETDELVLGDIMVSVDKVYEQAEEYGHSSKREFAFLIAHSMLHLLGYDHMEEEERMVMETKQEAILKALGITRNEE